MKLLEHAGGEGQEALRFVKMHGCGNDYLYFDCFSNPFEATAELCGRLCDRHKGVGADGLVLIGPSGCADARMRMYNRDGSEGKMCGNAVRCVGKLLYESGIAPRERVTVETRSGVKTLTLLLEGGEVRGAAVEMGAPEWEPSKIPADVPGPRAVSVPLSVGGTAYQATLVSMGNPHCVVFCGDPNALPLQKLGPLFERHPDFPEGVNTEFVRVVGWNELLMRVWERGSGETLACGTGACAAAAAAVENGFCTGDEEVLVHLRGGDLRIRVTDEMITMTGNAVRVFEGVIKGWRNISL